MYRPKTRTMGNHSKKVGSERGSFSERESEDSRARTPTPKELSSRSKDKILGILQI